MQDKQALIMRLLLNRYHPGSQKTLLSALPENEATKILNIAVTAKDPLPIWLFTTHTLAKIHYSWLIPKLQALPKNQASLVLSLVPESQALKLQKALSLSKTPFEISPGLKNFIAKKWLPDFAFDNVLPIEYLPHSEIAFLTNLDKQQLVELIDLLSLYDLAQEMQNIVDKKILEMIHKCLSPKKEAYLKQCTRVKEKLSSPKLNLELWDGSREKFSKLMHHRGMVRLGYALSGQHPDFLWHITHILDTGRGEKLKRFIQEKEISGVTATLKKQVQNAVQFITKASSL